MDFDADQYSLSAGDNGFHKGGNGYTVGQKVSHPSFGRGIVKNVEGMGDEAKVVISFPNYGEKKILASFLGLKKI